YVPRDHVPVFVPEFEHPEDLVTAKDEAIVSLLPPGFLSPRIRSLSPRALEAEMNAIASSLYHSLHPSGTPPLALEARVAVLETQAHRHEWQRHTADDFAVQHIMRTQALEARARIDTLEDTGTEGTVGLTRWIEKIEFVFNISGCAVENQVKFATCTLLDATLTWWNSHIRTLGLDAYTITWSVIKKKMTDKYCPLGEVKKLEIELWNLKVKDNNIPAYTNRFQELALICTKFVSNETEKVDKYISGLPENIYRNVKSSKPMTLDETIESTGNTNATNNRGGNGPNPRGNGCFECGNLRHFKRDCPKLNNKNEGNRNAQGWVYAVGNSERNGMLRETQTQMSSRVPSF
nr:reverse transcriptase domain-containing protein [Tanacetum cinerariifolium]